MSEGENRQIAQKLREVALLLEEQGANRFRIQAYRRAVQTLDGLERPVLKLRSLGGPARQDWRRFPASE